MECSCCCSTFHKIPYNHRITLRSENFSVHADKLLTLKCKDGNLWQTENGMTI